MFLFTAMISIKTTNKVYDIILKYLPKEKAIEMFNELSNVEGNSSFKDSIKNLKKLLESK